MKMKENLTDIIIKLVILTQKIILDIRMQY